MSGYLISLLFTRYMQGTQLTIWDVFEQTEETRLDRLIKWSFAVFDSLDPTLEYQLAFSGGKDSHVLLGIYLCWCKIRGKNLQLKVVFSDTFLESSRLYDLVDSAAKLCGNLSIPFLKVHPAIEKTFWVRLIGLGYPVPNYRNRWCTKDLKTKPMQRIGGIVLAGSHEGESTKRTARLKSCGSSECGIDKIANKVEPLTVWQNCDIWDWIILFSDEALYQGASHNLMSLYDITESEAGSLRMGCFMCPVVKAERIIKQVNDGIIPAFAIQVRELIEQLRIAPRINSPRHNKAGAILVDTRKDFWAKLQPYISELKEYKWITTEEIRLIEEMLERRAYPPTYKPEWIAEQEPLAKVWNPKVKS